MKSPSRLLLASLLGFGTLFAQHPPGGPGGGPGGTGFGGPPVTGAPFSAIKTETHQQTLADGNQISSTRTEKLYRDADGRTRTESTMTAPSGKTKTMVTIFDPVAGFMAHLNAADSTAMKQTLPPVRTGAAPKDHPAPPAGAPTMTKTDLGSSTVAGLMATGTSSTRTIAAGTIGNAQAIVETREVWMSTALKIPVKMTTTDPEHGNSSMLLSNVAESAQDPSLFVIPSGYTVKEGPAGGPGHGPGGPPPPPEQ